MDHHNTRITINYEHLAMPDPLGAVSDAQYRGDAMLSCDD